MKLIYTLALICAFGLCKAQTTMEEYLYATRGYRQAIESGMPVKLGYEVDASTTIPVPSGSLATMQFLRKAGTHHAVALIVFYHFNSPRAIDHYFCIPDGTVNDDVKLAAFNDWGTLFGQQGITDAEKYDGYYLLYLCTTAFCKAENCGKF